MEYLQYGANFVADLVLASFKPYYKWNTFNTKNVKSIRIKKASFKPYYKWNTFNTSLQ